MVDITEAKDILECIKRNIPQVGPVLVAYQVGNQVYAFTNIRGVEYAAEFVEAASAAILEGEHCLFDMKGS